MVEILRHKKTGGWYEVLHRGGVVHSDYLLADYAKASVYRRIPDGQIVVKPLAMIAAGDFEYLHCAQVQATTPLSDGDEVVVYRSKPGGMVWVRPTAEMDDGRFEPAHPDSATPSGDGAERATSGEIETLLSAHERACYTSWVESSRCLDGDDPRVANAWEEREATRTALLSRITSASSNTSGRDPSGPGSCASIEPAGAVSPAGGGFDPSRTGLPNINGRLIGAGWEKLNDGTDDRTFVVRVALGAPAPWPIRSVWESWPVSIAAQAMEAEGQDPKGLETKSDSAVTEGDVPASLSPTPPDLTQAAREDLERLADDFVLRVSEWDDRTSPEDWPEALLITRGELRCELLAFLEEAKSLQTPHQGLEDGRRPDGHGLSPSVGLASDPAGSAASIPGADDVLNARLKAAGMYTIPEMMGVTPLTRWTVQAGMTDLGFFQAWIERRLLEFLRMKAGYELGDESKGDDLYEWVLAHSAALSEVRENFLAARARDQRAKREDGVSQPRPEAASPVDGANSDGEAPVFECANCGSREHISDIRSKGFVSCCLERKMTLVLPAPRPSQEEQSDA